MRVGNFRDIAYGPGCYIFHCPSREAVDHGEVTFTDSSGGDAEIFFRTVWYIVFGISGRAVVPVRINSEYGEVPRVSRPHPVVGVASELSYGGRRSPYQANVAEHAVDEQEILVAVVQCLHIGFKPFASGCRLADQFPGIGFYQRIPLLLGHSFFISLQNDVRNVFHPV